MYQTGEYDESPRKNFICEVFPPDSPGRAVLAEYGATWMLVHYDGTPYEGPNSARIIEAARALHDRVWV